MACAEGNKILLHTKALYKRDWQNPLQENFLKKALQDVPHHR